MAGKRQPESNVSAFEEFADDLSGPARALGRMLAAELDRQAADGEGVNAALVARYLEVIGGVAVAEEEDPIGDVLAKILNEAPTGKT